ncbi:MAG TPA: alpha/beta hydrolase-fold protein [Solirubrobacteraceae bacterium]
MPRRRVLAAALAAVAIAAPAHARTYKGSFTSAALAGDERFAIYLPPGYATSGRRYPVIYALHGLPSGHRGYRHLPIAQWGAIAAAAGRPVIIVAPQGARDGDTDPEWHDWGTGRDWESAVAVDLVHDIDSTYRTIPDRRARAIIGLSAGGYGAALIGLRHLDEFSIIQSWSGYFHPTNPSGTAPLSVGSPQQNAAASAHTYVPRLLGEFEQHKPIYFSFYVGNRDWRFRPENQQLDRELTAAGVWHRFAVYSGGHSYALWNRHAQVWIRRAARQLAQG